MAPTAPDSTLDDPVAAQALLQPALETPLRHLTFRPPVGVARTTPLADALARMHDLGIGSVLVHGDDGDACGILTRHDILGRVTLPGVPLDTPIAAVMSTPLHAIDAACTTHDAALAMSRHGIRHLAVREGGRVIGVVSERDLFALQRLSLRHVGGAIRGAGDLAALRRAADDIRRYARELLEQGMAARRLTELVSHLNDLLTQRVLALLAAEHGVDLGRACWLAFGSEGRGEQTIATDQDNGLVFASDEPARDRPAWLAFGTHVNQALADCGYPLCKGGIMAGNPSCCLTEAEWLERFDGWMAHGAPRDLLAASIYFDFRPIAGDTRLAAPMRELLLRRAPALPRFIKQMADNALEHGAPLNWRGGIGVERLDLKMQGTVIFVDAARVFALAHGVPHTNTRARFEALAPLMRVPAREAEAWIGGFEFLQHLRLRAQIAARDPNPNLLEISTLNDLDRRTLRESLRVAHRLQQRMELDYDQR